MELWLFLGLINLLGALNTADAAALPAKPKPERVLSQTTSENASRLLVDESGQALNTGDPVRVHLNSGEVIQGHLTAIQQYSRTLFDQNISGEYYSELTGGKGKLDGKTGIHQVTLEQRGNRVLGWFGKHGEIEGRIH